MKYNATGIQCAFIIILSTSLVSGITLAESFGSKTFLGIGLEDTNFKSYRPSYFGYRTNHSNSGYEGEIKFQFSLKYQLTKDDVLKDHAFVNAVSSNWYFGYTQKSFWSIQESSEPFRENNFSPEFFKEINYNNWENDKTLKLLRVGLYQHESTGESGVGSHGWNVSYLEAVFRYGNLVFAPKVWVPEFFSRKEDAAPDNPDIFDYYGHGELKLFYEQSNNLIHSLMYRQGHNSDLYGFRWQTDFYIKDWNPKFFVQYWSGYGESLKDYNNKTHGVVIGLSAVH